MSYNLCVHTFPKLVPNFSIIVSRLSVSEILNCFEITITSLLQNSPVHTNTLYVNELTIP